MFIYLNHVCIMSQSLVIDLYSLLCFVVRSLYETGERKWTELQYWNLLLLNTVSQMDENSHAVGL